MKFNSIRTDGDTVYVSLVGPQPPAVAADMLVHFRHAIERVRAQHEKVYVYVDLGGVTLKDISSDARLAMKEAFTYPFHRLAAVGHSHMMEVAMYLMKAGGAETRAQYFTSATSAKRWLRASQRADDGRLNNSVLAMAALITLIGVSSLLGWMSGNEYLMRWVTYTSAVHPLDSFGMVALGIILAGMWANKRSTVISGLVAIGLLGVLGSFQNGLTDRLLSGLGLENVPSQAIDAGTIAYILVAASVLLLHVRRRGVQIAVRIFAAVIVLAALLSISNQLYEQNLLFGWLGLSSMALSLATGFLIIGTLVGAAAFGKRLEVLRQKVSVLGWAVVLVFILVQVAACAGWRQATDRNESDARRNLNSLQTDARQLLNNRSRAYTDALHGYRGLFESSEFVGQDEFQEYYQAVRLNQNYPGLRSLVFVSRVPDDVLKKFPTSQRNSSGATQPSSPLVVKNLTNAKTHYILTYIAGTTNNSSIGNDLAADPSRANTFAKAERSGDIVSSGTVDLAPSPTAAGGPGFFLAVPVEDRGRAAAGRPQATSLPEDKYAGFVGAVFEYKAFFWAVFSDSDLLNGVTLTIKDAETDERIYAHESDMDGATIDQSFDVSFADSTWNVNLKAPATYGVSLSQRDAPRSVIITGQVLSGLLLAIFFILWRSRRSAFALADTITSDLQRERNRAVGLQQKDDAILSSIGDAVFALDPEGKITLFNPAAEKVSGYSSDEVVGKPYDQVLQFFYAKDNRPNKDFIDEARAGKLSSMKDHTYLIHKDGHHVAVADSAAPIRDNGGMTIGSIVVFRDVSKEEELDRAKTEFVSLASHQLRTPLSAINWYSEMLLDEDSGKLNKDQREYAKEIYDGNQRMVELVNALLDVSRLDLGKIKSEPAPVRLDELTDGVLKELLPSIKVKKQNVVDEVDHKLPTMMSDAKMLRMIVQNLLSNAVKYTPDKGTVSVSAAVATPAEIRKAKLKAGGSYVILKVTDTGYGIPKVEQPNIFGKMFRADNVRKLDVEGTGLGLYIVKEVALKLGGAVWFESTEGKGTTFFTVLPLEVAEQPKDSV